MTTFFACRAAKTLAFVALTALVLPVGSAQARDAGERQADLRSHVVQNATVAPECSGRNCQTRAPFASDPTVSEADLAQDDTCSGRNCAPRGEIGS